MFMKSKFADLTIGIETQSPKVENFLKKYLVDDSNSVDFSISTTIEEIEAEDDKLSAAHFSLDYLETLAILRKIAEQFPFYQRFLMHGATIAYEGKAYMFTALSGVGKSTHIKLWKRFLGESVQIVNGDKPFLWVKDSEVEVYGSPWAGKENWHRNTHAPLGGICFLKRGTENRIRRIQPEQCLMLIMKQIYQPASAEAAGLTLELLDKMLKIVPLYLLECDMSENAVKTSFEALTGLNFEECKAEVENEDCTYAD